jgi:hypothetical protein
MIKKRYYDMVLDQGDMFNTKPTGTVSWEGHQHQYKGWQRGLRKLLKEADSKGCKACQSDAWDWATRPAPQIPWGRT